MHTIPQPLLLLLIQHNNYTNTTTTTTYYTGETAILSLIKHIYFQNLTDENNANLRTLEQYTAEVRQIADTEYQQYFTTAYNEVKRQKLGFGEFRTADYHNLNNNNNNNDCNTNNPTTTTITTTLLFPMLLYIFYYE